jgi:hypothetical protein
MLIFLFGGHGDHNKNGYTWLIVRPRENDVKLKFLDGFQLRNRKVLCLECVRVPLEEYQNQSNFTANFHLEH